MDQKTSHLGILKTYWLGINNYDNDDEIPSIVISFLFTEFCFILGVFSHVFYLILNQNFGSFIYILSCFVMLDKHIFPFIYHVLSVYAGM